MNKFNQIALLRDIWAKIPKSKNEQIVLYGNEIVRKMLNLFHPGQCFYYTFNTRTTVMENVSPEIIDLLGYSPGEFTLPLFMGRMHPDDLPYYIHYQQRAVGFFSRLVTGKLMKYKFNQDLRFQHQNGQYLRLLIQTVPLYFFPEGGACTLNIFTDITYLKLDGQPQLSFIGLEGEPSFYNIAPGKDIKITSPRFTRREKEILYYVIEGMTSLQIGNKLFITKYTVDTHRKNILAKANCSTTIELTAKSIKEGWI